MPLPIGGIPPAVNALTAAVRAALPLPDAEGGVEVFDGPSQGRPYAERSVTVGAAFEEDQDAISVDRTPRGGSRRVVESISVACSAYVGGGESDDEAIDGYRTVMGQLLTAVADRLHADPTLGGAVAMAQLTSATWLQGRDEQGAGVMVGFIVALRVFS